MRKFGKCLFLTFMLLLMAAPSGWTQSRTGGSGEGVLVGRIAHLEGQVLRFVPEEKNWAATVKDAPFGLDDSLYSEAAAKAELIMPNNTWIRIGGSTQIQLISLRTDVTEIDLASGMARFYNRAGSGVIKVTSPFGYVVAPAGAVFDLYVGDQSLEVVALKGKVAFILNNDQTRYEVVAGSPSVVSDGRQVTSGQGEVDADWDDWNAERDRLWSKRTEVQGESVRYLPPNLQDDAYSLDENGRWERVYYEGGYRNFWRPVRVAPGWAPFTAGRWTVYYGDNCWVPYEPFGYITHHYGNWVFVGSSNSWYWAPPVVGVVVNTGPFLAIPLGWYPGRVGWIHSGANVGWIPLAPFEPYYCRRPWGPRTMVVNNINITNININRYQYVNRAVIVNQKNFYHVNNYQSVRLTNVQRNAIVNNYRAAPVIDARVIPNYDSMSGRHHFANIRVDKKPHGMVMDRIISNEQLAMQARNVDANHIQRDVSAKQFGRPLPGVGIQPPRISDKLVGGNEVNKPRTDLQIQQRDIKARTKPPSEIVAGQRPAIEGRPDVPGTAPHPEKSGEPGTKSDDGQRLRPPRTTGEAPTGQAGQGGRPLDDGQRLRPPRTTGEAPAGQAGQGGRALDDGQRLRPPRAAGEVQAVEPGQARPGAGETSRTRPPTLRQDTRPSDSGMPGQTRDQNLRVRPGKQGGDAQPSQPGMSGTPNDNVRKMAPPEGGKALRQPGGESLRQAPSGGGREVRPPESRSMKEPPEARKKSTVLQDQPRPDVQTQPVTRQPEPSASTGKAFPRPPQIESGGHQEKQPRQPGLSESPGPRKGREAVRQQGD